MLTLSPYEFQFEYVNELTDKIVLDYNPTNDSNRVVTDKRIGNTDELLDGVTLRIERKVDNGWETIDEWMTGDVYKRQGRIHINKRDLELYNADQDGSYGLTQGDGTLEGAVYGLFAGQDLSHPDGKSGIVYNQNDLVARCV